MFLNFMRDLTAFDKRYGMPFLEAFLCRFLSICSSERSLDLSPFSHPKALPAQVGLFILKLLRFICHSDESWCAVPSSQLVERGRASLWEERDANGLREGHSLAACTLGSF